MADAIEMVEVDGVLWRPEDVERARAISESRPERPEPLAMLDIDGVQYRPEDAKRLGLVPADDDDEPEAPTRGDVLVPPADLEAGDEDEDDDEEEDEPDDPAVIITSATAQGGDHGDAHPGDGEQAGEQAAPRKRERRRS